MTFEEILDQAIALLQRRGRLTYRALKRPINLDDDYLEDVKAELIHRSLGTLYAATGQREQARTELGAAIDLYRAMDMTLWLPQTEAAWAQAVK